MPLNGLYGAHIEKLLDKWPQLCVAKEGYLAMLESSAAMQIAKAPKLVGVEKVEKMISHPFLTAEQP